MRAQRGAIVRPLNSALSEQDSRQSQRLGVLSAVTDIKSPAPVLAARILQFQATILSHEKFVEAATAFATDIASLLRFERAAIGFCRGGHTRIVATSHTADFQANSDLFNRFSAAMEEALDQASTIAFPAMPGTRPLITLAHAELSKSYRGTVCTVPLVSRGRAFGALTLVRASETITGKEELALCEHLACITGPILELKWESERSWRERLLRSLRVNARRLIEPGNAVAKTGVAVAAAILLALLFVPVQYRIGAQARIEGSIQRVLVAPSDGFLRQVYARPGDTVKANQVVAELGEEDMRLERRKWESELTQHENAASAALSRADRTQFVINQAKADEARAQLSLVDAHLSRARIVAPFDGIVIKGDLSQSLGAPLRRGDVLLTVAPANEFRLLIDVDERDIATVRPGQKGSVALGALMDRALAFDVVRVTPVASTREDRNVFEVEGKLRETASTLRPGMQGIAKLDAGYQPLAWIWTHRFVEWLRMMLWSVGA
jgi:biotin carboxyl carrier protein